MLRNLVGGLVTLAALVLPVPPAGADPGSATLQLQVSISCYGCGIYGPVGNSVSGTVTVGHGPLATGAPVTGTFTVNGPAGVTCVYDSEASGTLTIGTRTTPFSWDLGGSMWALPGFGSGPAAFQITSPAGNPCGGPVTATATVVLDHAVTAGAPATGQASIFRLPDSYPPGIRGVRLWGVPVAPNGSPWNCRDARTAAPVGAGSLLDAPDPGIVCTPPAPYSNACDSVFVGRYMAFAGTGSITATSACSGLSTSVTSPVPGTGPLTNTATGFGITPWRCSIDESLAVPGDSGWGVVCRVG